MWLFILYLILLTYVLIVFGSIIVNKKKLTKEYWKDNPQKSFQP